MKKLLVLLLVLTACSPKHLPQVIIKDSVRVEIRERVVHDSVPYAVPVIVEKVVTRDTSSYLENDWAESYAEMSDGFLYHTLETKPHTIYVPVEVTVHDTTVVEKTGEEVVIEKPVEKPLNWWQRFRLKGFWWLLAGFAAALVYIFRKPILALLRTFLV